MKHLRISDLFEFAFCSYVFALDNRSYEEFVKNTGSCSPCDKKYCGELFSWLRKWGCRQFTEKDEPRATDNLKEWSAEYGELLLNNSAPLDKLSDADLIRVQEAFDELARKKASLRGKQTPPSEVSFGPVGAAKILFALRPRTFIPWDGKIAGDFHCPMNGKGYVQFLRHIQGVMAELSELCKACGFTLVDLPRKLGRRGTTVPKLIDEYYWIRITNNWCPPSGDVLDQWVKFARGIPAL